MFDDIFKIVDITFVFFELVFFVLEIVPGMRLRIGGCIGQFMTVTDDQGGDYTRGYCAADDTCDQQVVVMLFFKWIFHT
jgi:hypothetical protein